MKKALLILLTLIIGINLNAQAEDFSAVYNGDTIYYNITSSTAPYTVAVTYRGASYGTYSDEYSGVVSIPDSVLYNNVTYKVSSIGAYAFYFCFELTSINIPNSVTSIGSNAFQGCCELTSITLPNSISSIGASAFYNCYELTSITIPNSVTSIGGGAFSGCSGLTSITLPNSISSIGGGAFSGCSGLTAITLPNSITSIGNNSFQNCSRLTSITIPNSVTSIGYEVFNGCIGLTSITIGNSVTSIGYSAFNGCIGLTSITIPNSVTSIGDAAFSRCSGLISITIPSSVTSISYDTFDGCSGLTSITIPSSVSSIGMFAFQGCSGLTSITIPSSVTSIGGAAFNNCTGLDTIICNAIIPPNITSATFWTIPNNIPIRIPCSSILQYQTRPYWSSFTNFIEQDSCIYSISVLSEDSTKGTVTGGGEFPFSTITITATPKQDCVFLGWNDGDVNSNRIINATQDSVFTAWFKRIITTNISDTICQGHSYQFFNNNLTTTGLYSQTVQLSPTLDSIVNLNLYVLSSLSVNQFNEVVCNLYIWNDSVYTVSGDYIQILPNSVGCDSIITLHLTVTSPPNIELDMVTVDLNNHNEVIWNKNETVDHYNIYREGIVMGQFDLIATVPFDSVSMFIDTNSNPTIKSYMYKISTTDTCLNESALSPFHKTMHLTISQGMGNNWNLNWTPYEGTSYTTYNIYRGINNLDSLKYLTTISASNTSYTDVNVPSGYVYYQVEILKDTTTSNKASGINSIRSNYATNNTNSINEISSNNILTKLYPNPTSNKATLEIEGLSNDADVIVSDLLGRGIEKYKFNSEKGILEIDVSEFAKGVYSVSVKNNNINVSKKLIVQ